MGGSCSCLSSKPKHDSRMTMESLDHDSCMTIESLESLDHQSSTQSIEEQIEHSRTHWSQVSERIEHSKTHWSQVSKFELDANEVAEVSNVEVFLTLQSHPKWGNFFVTFGKDGMGGLVMGEKFVEGGQAELYDLQIKWSEPWKNEEDSRVQRKWVLKVFKKGTFLQKLQQQWPSGMLQDYVDNVEWESLGNLPKFKYYCVVYLGILLEDGRFAFLMVKEYGDLRHQIDCYKLTRRQNQCPFSKIDVEKIMYEVAAGMAWLHTCDIIHRDLKASNVLCTSREDDWTCSVADFECSIGVVGIGFFRAPEILQACKDHIINKKLELFTKASDVYSYGMLCYEILTGKLPFEGYKQNDYDHVLGGGRPKVPEYVDGWIQDLLRMCWQSNPIDRPSFRQILEVLLATSKKCRKIHAFRKIREVEKAMGIIDPPPKRWTI